jgi:predicted nucleic acid-binding protein
MDAIDSSVLVAAIFEVEAHHDACDRLLDQGGLGFYAHGLAEVFCTITGGRLAQRLSPEQATELLESDFVPFLHLTHLTPAEILRAMRECQGRGVQGGAIYDSLHLAAARKHKADRFFTLNESHFRAIHRVDDAAIVHP